MNGQTHTDALSAMSTTVTVISVGIPVGDHARAMNNVAAEVDEWQRLFSRFRSESTLSHVNASAGSWIKVNETFLDLLAATRDAVIATDGRFNPAVLPALEANGYDRTINEVRERSIIALASSGTVAGTDAWQTVAIDRHRGYIRLPPGMRIDLGGIAKGALADRLADRYRQWPGGAISIGGDMRVWGEPPDGESWRVGIEHPLDTQHDIVTVELHRLGGCAVATSSRTRRAWRTTEGTAHHLIDPASGFPVESPLLAVTVCARTAVAAEIVTKNLMVASAHRSHGRDLLLDADWALTVDENLSLNRISREAA